MVIRYWEVNTKKKEMSGNPPPPRPQFANLSTKHPLKQETVDGKSKKRWKDSIKKKTLAGV